MTQTNKKRILYSRGVIRSGRRSRANTGEVITREINAVKGQDHLSQATVSKLTPDGKVNMAKPSANNGKKSGSGGFVTWFRHYRTGQILVAANYGYKAWPFGRAK